MLIKIVILNISLDLRLTLSIVNYLLFNEFLVDVWTINNRCPVTNSLSQVVTMVTFKNVADR